MAQIHPTAIIAPSAKIHETATVGPYCIIGEEVSIGANTVLHRHVVVSKFTKIGQNNEIFQFASIGEDCQDLKYAGEKTWLEIGDNNIIRESCSLHRGTIQDKGLTKIGSNNLFMGNTHIAHDCVIGDNNVFANNVGIAGHVIVGSHTVIGGNSGIHQFCRIDDYSLIAGATLIVKDVMAFTTVAGNPAKVRGLNIKGMQRKGWSKQTLAHLHEAYNIVFRQGLIKAKAVAKLEDLVIKEPKVALMIDSLNNSVRGIIR